MMDKLKKWLPFQRGDERAKRIEPRGDQQHPLARLERDLHQLMERFGSSWSDPFGLDRADAWFGDFSPATFTPTLDLADKRKHLEVTLELPGIEPDDVDIEVRDGFLVVRGHKRTEETSEEEGYFRTERSFGAFERVVPLPAEVDGDRAEATCKKGVLRVKLPKVKPEAESRTRKITVKSS